MEIILFVVVGFYAMYLNLRLREVQEELLNLEIDVAEIEIKAYDKMLSIRKEIRESLKTKKVEKSRRRSTKRRSKIS